ncbi:MAG: hypothetical protein WB992_01610, partial [Bryobacteraceae bacterium]
DGEVAGDAAAAIEIHLQACDQCRSRLEELRRAEEAYAEYQRQVLKPVLHSSREWPKLDLHKSNPPTLSAHFPHPFRWAIAAFACCLILIGLFLYHETPHRRMTQFLAHASSVPTSPRRRLQVTSNGRSWYRPAILREGIGGAASATGFEHTQALFVKANYSWDDPLSARSFAAWRNELPDKRDQVVSIQSEDGNGRFYRLRTDTSQGVLRMASLTLRADTLHPVAGRFHFEDQEDVMMTDAGEMPVAQPSIESRGRSAPDGAAIERRVSPEDELRVFAALNAIGADAGEPLTVDIDPLRRHIVVSGVGISGAREREIRQALGRIPNATMHFDSGRPLPTGKATIEPNTDSTGTSAPLRRLLESRARGAQQFQAIADRALDLSSSLLAQAHALNVLAQRFSPAVESSFGPADRVTLRSLRNSHAVTIGREISQLREALAPLLASPPKQRSSISETRNAPLPPWQGGADQLLEASKRLDASLSRLLAGSYSEQTGEDILNRLPDEIENVEKLARAQETAQ